MSPSPGSAHRPVAALLDAPAFLGSLRVSNRAVVAPMSRVSAGPGGVPTPRMAEYYGRFSRGGFGLVVTEGTYTDASASRAYAGQPGLVTAAQTHGWTDVVTAVHAEGGAIVAQLMHAGALSQHLDATIGASAVQPLGEKMPEYGGEGPFPVPRAADEADLETAIAGFAAAAAAARDIGFDGVEVHGANGYLIDQFITGYTNQREDRYGGDAAQRTRLAVEVVEAVRAAVGADFVVGLRLSQTKVNDMVHRWRGVAEATAILERIATAPLDYLHIASEGRDWRATAQLDDGPTVTRLARDLTGLPVIANGGMHAVEQAMAVLADGEADLVSIGRGALANPDWPARVRDGEALHPFEGALLQPTADLAAQDAWAGVER